MEVSSSHRSFSSDQVDGAKKQIDELVAGVDKDCKAFLIPINTNARGMDHSGSIFHYTSDVGLEGILDKKELWLTDLFNLNDPSELIFGLDIFAKFVSERVKFAGQLADLIKQKLDALRNPDRLRETANFFSLSMSWHENDLAQWRSYADNGRGFALEFDRTLLDEVSKICIERVKSIPICYDESKLQAALTGIADVALNCINKFTTEPDLMIASEYGVSRVILTVTRYAIVSSLYFKHEAYVQERELRYLEINRQTDIDFSVRKRSYEIIAYRPFKWFQKGKQPLRSIVVGPAGGAKSLQFARDCLRLHGKELGEVTIRESGLPYRA